MKSDEGINEAEKRYWKIHESVKQLKSENNIKNQIKVLEEELDSLVQNKHPLLAYYQEILEQNRQDMISDANVHFQSVSNDSDLAFAHMTDHIESEFLKLSESVFSSYMDVLNERKKGLDRDKEQSTATSFNRRDQSKNIKDPSIPYTKLLLNDIDKPEDVLEKLNITKRKLLTTRPGEKLKQSEIDNDINLIRLHVHYRPEKYKKQQKRQRRERIEKEEFLSDDDRNEEDGIGRKRPKRRARRAADTKEVAYSDDLSDEQ